MRFTDAGVTWTRSIFETAAAAESFGLETKTFRNTLYEKEVASADTESVSQSDETSVVTTIIRGRLPTGKVLSHDGSSYVNDRSKEGSAARKLKESTHVWDLSAGTTGRGGWILKPPSTTSTLVVGSINKSSSSKLPASSSSGKLPASKKRAACAGCECGGCKKFKKIKNAAIKCVAAAEILSQEMENI